jgi:hypothetical protein
VSFETSFDSKQPKLEPKLVSALSETKCLFRLFRFYTETESFGVSVEPKQTEDQPKQFDREHILVFYIKFCVISVCFETVCFGCFEFYTETASFDVEWNIIDLFSFTIDITYRFMSISSVPAIYKYLKSKVQPFTRVSPCVKGR